MTTLLKTLRRFRRSESGGTSTIEFVILLPIVMFFFVTAFELFWIGTRIAFFERGVDMSLREIRLNTGNPPDYDEVKTLICDNAQILPDCNNALRLELIRIDPRTWNGSLSTPRCSDKSEEIEPPTPLSAGESNDLMIMRACARFEPLVLNFGLGSFFELGADGRFPVMSINAFVQEPE